MPVLQPPDAPAPAVAVRLAVENDLLALRGTGAPADYDYTHGTRLSAAWRALPDGAAARAAARLAKAAPGCADAAARRAGCLLAEAGVAQAIYTPRRDAPTPVPGERPYAAVLAADAALTRVGAGGVRTVALMLGTTGPPALGAPVQNGVHHLLGNVPQEGWARQLAAWPVVQLRAEAVRWAERQTPGGVLALRLRGAGEAGTLGTRSVAGADAVFGFGPRQRWTPAEPEVARPTRAFVRAGAAQEVVLHDALVEGWPGTAGAARRALVPRAELALGARWRGGAVAYRHVVRGREYQAQPRPHAYGALTVTLNRR